MSLEHFVVPENKDVLKNKQTNKPKKTHLVERIKEPF